MEALNIFVKSIFVDNMIFAYFLGMCSFLAVSKNVKTAIGLGIAVIFVLGITLPINYLLNKYLLSPGALSWISPDLANVDLSFLSFIIFIAVIASFVQLVEMVFSFPVFLSGNLPSADCSKLRHPGCIAVHAAEGFPEPGNRNLLRTGKRRGLVPGHRVDCGNQREDSIFKGAETSSGTGHHIHNRRPYGYRLHGLYGH